MIYLADWYISWFVKYIHPKIKHPYILISNDTDGSHPDFGSFDYNKNTRLYMNIQLGTHPSRRPIVEFFQERPYCFSR